MIKRHYFYKCVLPGASNQVCSVHTHRSFFNNPGEVSKKILEIVNKESKLVGARFVLVTLNRI